MLEGFEREISDRPRLQSVRGKPVATSLALAVGLAGKKNMNSVEI